MSLLAEFCVGSRCFSRILVCWLPLMGEHIFLYLVRVDTPL